MDISLLINFATFLGLTFALLKFIFHIDSMKDLRAFSEKTMELTEFRYLMMVLLPLIGGAFGLFYGLLIVFMAGRALTFFDILLQTARHTVGFAGGAFFFSLFGSIGGYRFKKRPLHAAIFGAILVVFLLLLLDTVYEFSELETLSFFSVWVPAAMIAGAARSITKD